MHMTINHNIVKKNQSSLCLSHDAIPFSVGCYIVDCKIMLYVINYLNKLVFECIMRWRMSYSILTTTKVPINTHAFALQTPAPPPSSQHTHTNT